MAGPAKHPREKCLGICVVSVILLFLAAACSGPAEAPAAPEPELAPTSMPADELIQPAAGDSPTSTPPAGVLEQEPTLAPSAAAPGEEPTPTLPPGAASLTGSTLNEDNTGEIIEEIAFFGIGGPGGVKCAKPQTRPIFDEEVSAGEIMDTVSLSSCGWQPGEIVTVTMRDPLGQSVSLDLQAEVQEYSDNPSGFVDLDYQPPLDAPAGDYTFTLQGSSGELATTVNFSQPEGARLVPLSGDPFHTIWDLPVGPSHRLQLFGFAPGEPIRLIVYNQNGWLFYGYQDFTAGMDGRLLIDVNLSGINPGEGLLFIAHGEQTGSVPMLINTSGSYTVYERDFYCPGTMPSRIKQGQPARAASVDGSNLRIRAEPGFDGPVLESVPEGTELDLSAYYFRCADQTFWWKVQLPNQEGEFGWVAESSEGVYLIEPIE